MTTISSSTTIGITLSSPPDVNPIVVDSGVTISNTGNAVYASSGYWVIQNGGTISSTNQNGVDLLSGGSVTNTSSGSIGGYTDGVYISGAAGTVVNYAGIGGTNRAGVNLQAGGSVTNVASAAITGGQYGVDLISGGSVTDAAYATISGGTFGIVALSGASVSNGATHRLRAPLTGSTSPGLPGRWSITAPSLDTAMSAPT